jgi:hypothetical protein
MVGSAVERLNDLESDELLGPPPGGCGVALDRLEKRAAGFLSSRSKVLADGRFAAGEDLLECLGRGVR